SARKKRSASSSRNRGGCAAATSSPRATARSAAARHPESARLLMDCDLAFVTPSVSEGPGGRGGANVSLMPPTPPGPSLTLGVTAWRDAVHVGFTGGRTANLLRMTPPPRATLDIDRRPLRTR